MDRLVWIDCEMTGLDAASDVLLEVACLVTDSELTILDEGIDLVISAPEEALAAMVPVVREMHQTSGLTEAVRASTLTLADAEQQVLDYVRARVPEVRKAPLCGNSIATDRTFIARYMPSLDAHLHYRMVDVSSIKELARRWYARAYYAAPAKRGGHRALADIQESIEELRYYRQALFVPQPGPGTEQARAIAAEVRGQADAALAALAAGGRPNPADTPIAGPGSPGAAAAGPSAAGHPPAGNGTSGPGIAGTGTAGTGTNGTGVGRAGADGPMAATNGTAAGTREGTAAREGQNATRPAGGHDGESAQR